MKKSKKRFLLFFLLLNFSLFSQNLPYYPIDFYANDLLLKNATAGGLDLPQFSSADLNNDGLSDLFVFDKLGRVSLGFINNGISGEADYIYDFELTKNFPPLNEWVLLQDFNQDGAVDIFGYSDLVGVDGIQVYQGFWDGNELDFFRMEFPEIAVDLLPFSNGTTSQRIAPTKFDFPAIDDLDDDGDLDILAFGGSSSYVEFYKNQSVEMGYGLDSLIFQREDICWGKFLQDPISGEIIISNNAEDCAYNSPNLNAVHTIASSLITLDLDGDSDKDLLFTNFENNEMLFLNNNGNSSEAAHITNLETAFSTVNFPDNPAFITTPFLLDIDNDQQRDLVISNFVFGRESYDVGWFFKNTQTDENPIFELQQTDFLTATMLDLGSGAHPSFIDFNADGLQDLVVGNAQKWDGSGNRIGSLKLFLNTGTTTLPQFELIDNDWLGFATDTLNHANLAPDFGDLDGDGDFDLLVGESNGKLNYFENIAGANAPMEFVFQETHFLNLNADFSIGFEMSPQIIDVNRDSLLDLIIGERNGNLNYFQNIGTPTQPEFDLNPENTPNNASFGEINFNFPGSAQGYASPFLIDVDGSFRLLVGSENTGIHEFINIDDNLEGAFSEVEDAFSTSIRQGNFQNPALADLDNDGFLEIVIGNMRGGLSFFKTSLLADGMVTTNNVFLNEKIQVKPNPCKDILTVSFIHNKPIFDEINIYNLQGKLVKTIAIFNTQTNISMDDVEPGIYFLKGVTAHGSWVEKILKL